MILAAVSGEALVHLVLAILIAGLIFGLLHWLIGYCSVPEPFAKVARVVLAIIAVLVLINALLSLIGHPLIVW